MLHVSLLQPNSKLLVASWLWFLEMVFHVCFILSLVGEGGGLVLELGKRSFCVWNFLLFAISVSYQYCLLLFPLSDLWKIKMVISALFPSTHISKLNSLARTILLDTIVTTERSGWVTLWRECWRKGKESCPVLNSFSVLCFRLINVLCFWICAVFSVSKFLQCLKKIIAGRRGGVWGAGEIERSKTA